LVQDEHPGALGHGLCNGHPLALTAGELHAALPHDGLVPVGEALHELVHVGGPTDPAHQIHVDATPVVHAVTDVLGDGAMQHLGILGNVRDVAPQRVLRDTGDVLAVD